MKMITYEMQSFLKNGKPVKDIVSLDYGISTFRDGTPPSIFLNYTLRNGKTFNIKGWNWQSLKNPQRNLIYSDDDIYTINMIEKESENDRL